MSKHIMNYVCAAVCLLALGQCSKGTGQKMEKLESSSPHRSNETTSEPQFLTGEGKIPGEFLNAFLIAHKAFIEDSEILPHKRKIENYWVILGQEAESYKIDFVAKRKPSEKEVDGGESELGRDVTYFINKKTNKMLYRQFYK